MTDEEEREESGKPVQNEQGEWVCPECGQTYKLAIQLGAHRKTKHGVAGTSRETRRTRGKKSDSAPRRREESRKTRIAKALRDLANLSEDLRGHDAGDLPERLALIIREDADALATLIASAAEHLNPLAFAVDKILWAVAPLTGSQRVLRWLLRAWRRQLEARELEPERFEPEPVEVAWRGETPDEPDLPAAADGG